MRITIQDFFKTVHGPNSSQYYVSSGVSPTNHARVRSDNLEEWFAAAQSRNENCWYRFNLLDQPTGRDGAARDEDVRLFAGIPIDVDLPASYESADSTTLDTWRQSVVTALLNHAVLPKPTIILSSGGGVQALILFDVPLDIDPTRYGAIVRGAAQTLIASGLGTADTKICNPSRLLRIPFGYNFKRRLNGAFPEARILHCDPALRYTLDRLLPLVALDKERVTPEPSAPDANLFHGIFASPQLQRIIMHGPQAIPPLQTKLLKKFTDESRGVMYVTAQLWAHGNTPQTIHDALLIEGSWTRAHIMDKPDPDREIARKLEPKYLQQCYPAAYHLGLWNQKYVFLSNFGGHPVVAWPDPDGRLQVQQKGLFAEGHPELMWPGGKDKNGKPLPFMPVWFKDKHTRRFDNIVRTRFPVKDPKAYNLWTGWGVPPIEKPGGWSLMQEHIEKIICSDNAEYGKFLIDWLAWGVQHDGPMQSAIVMHGQEGTGKNTLTEEYGALFPKDSYICPSDSSLVLGHFNDILQNANVVTLDEALFYGNRAQNSALKGLLTNPNITLHKKNFGPMNYPNNLRVFILTNEQHSVRAGPEARRFFQVELSPTRRCDMPYFKALRQQMASGGRSAMLYDLLHRDLTGFNPASVVKTDLLQSEQEDTDSDNMERYSNLEFQIDLWLAAGKMPGARPQEDGSLQVNASDLSEWMLSNRREKVHNGRLGRNLRKWFGGTLYRASLANYQILPPLSECRDKWNLLHHHRDYVPNPEARWTTWLEPVPYLT
jgi:hypothetical protein